MRYEAREADLRDQLTRITTAKREGKAEGKAETICQYLEVRFGSESQVLQETVHSITDLDTLGRIINRIFQVTNLNEAKALIKDSLIS